MLRPSKVVGDERKPHPTRTKLLEITIEHIRRAGSDDIDIAAVLEEAGFTKGPLYYHFGSVSDLIVAALVQIYGSGLEETIDRYRAMLDSCSSLEELRQQIHEIIRWSQSADRAPQRAEHARILALSTSNPELRAQIASIQEKLTGEIAEVMAEFQMRSWLRRDIDPHAFAVFGLAFSLGRIIDDLVDEENRVIPENWTNLIITHADTFFIATP